MSSEEIVKQLQKQAKELAQKTYKDQLFAVYKIFANKDPDIILAPTISCG